MDQSIAIIGAGAAGIAAATKLYENGFHNLIILEAEDRVGGRVNTVPFGENVVDMGAQWCHGEEGNVVYEMVKDLDLVASSVLNVADGFEYRKANGQIVNKEKTAKLDELAFRISEDLPELRKFNGGFGNYILQRFNNEISTNEEYNDIDSELAKEYIQTFQHYMNALHASDTWFDLSSNLQYEDAEGDRTLNWKGKGYKTILDVMMKKIPNPELALPIDDKIFLNKRVIRIEWNKDEKADVTIVCDDGTSYTAAHVILTVSLGVLKENYTDLFQPPLPPAKQKAIQALGFGTLNKVFLEFETANWPEKWPGFSILWTDDELVEIKKLHGDWIGDILGFLTTDHQPKLLSAWIAGLKAKEMEQLSDESIGNGLKALLDKFVPDYKIGQLKSVKPSRWTSKKNFRGSYSYRSVVTNQMDIHGSDLATPVETEKGEFTLQFAGEATHARFVGTVNGAIETGWREAQRIIDQYKK